MATLTTSSTSNGKIRDRILTGVIVALITLATGAMAAMALWDRVTGDLRACDAALEAKNEEQERDIREIEKTMTRLDERTARMEKDITEIKEAVR